MQKPKQIFGCIFILTLLVFAPAAALAAADGDGILEPGENLEEELAKASQNPVSSLISVPFENNTTFNNGTEDSVVDILSIKPVIPMSFGENLNLINRIIVPVIYQEERFPDEGNRFKTQ